MNKILFVQKSILNYKNRAWLVLVFLCQMQWLLANKPVMSIQVSSDKIFAGEAHNLGKVKVTVRRTGGDARSYIVKLGYAGSANSNAFSQNRLSSIVIPGNKTTSSFEIVALGDGSYQGRRNLDISLQSNAAYQIDSKQSKTSVLIDDLFVHLKYPYLDAPLHHKDGISEEKGGGEHSQLLLRLPDDYHDRSNKTPIVLYFSGGSGSVRDIGPYVWSKDIEDAGFSNLGQAEHGYAFIGMSTYKSQDTFGIEEHDGQLNARNWNGMLDGLKNKYSNLNLDWEKMVATGYSNGGRAIFAVASDTQNNQTKTFLDRLSGILQADGSQLDSSGAKEIGQRAIPVGLVSLYYGSYMMYPYNLLNNYLDTSELKHWDGNGSALNQHNLSTFNIPEQVRPFLDSMMGSGKPIVPNDPPKVSLSGFSSGITIQQGETLNLYASASDDKAVTKVEFFASGVLLESDSIYPYEAVFDSSDFEGTVWVHAVAYDADDAITKSTYRYLSVDAGVINQPPEKTWIQVSSTKLNAGEVLKIRGGAKDDYGLKHLELYQNGRLLAKGAKPFEFNWNTTGHAGEHVLKIVAVDQGGLKAESKEIDIVVEGQTSTYPVIGQIGKIYTEQVYRGQWHKVSFGTQLKNPIVKMSCMSHFEQEPFILRVRNITGSGFEWQMEEWENHDGIHAKELLTWMAIEKGFHITPNKMHIQAGVYEAGSYSDYFRFHKKFYTSPVVFTQVMGVNEALPVVSRVKGVSAHGFGCQLQGSEMNGRFHVNEQLGWIAIVPRNEVENGKGYHVFKTPFNITDEPSVIMPEAVPTNPLVISDMVSANGIDTSIARSELIDGNQLELWIEEEQTQDDEVTHAIESVAVGLFSKGFIYGKYSTLVD